MPVQDGGFIRSAVAFAENHLLAITGRRTLEGRPALEAVLRLMADPEAARREPLLKIERPELGRLFGAKRISVETYWSPPLRESLIELVQSNQEKLLRPVKNLEAQALSLEQLEQDFAIIPRPQAWISPAQLADELGARPAATDRLEGEVASQWKTLKRALAEDNADAGGPAARALADAVRAAARAQGAQLPHLGLDAFYHEQQPFAKSAFFYLLAALGSGASLLFRRRWPAWVGYASLGAGLAAQIVGLAARWVLSGRAPLSNMYESFTFATAGMIVVALAFELAQGTRLAGLGAGILGFVFMVLAHKAPIFDSRIRPLMPALQSSWLTYHVVTIMLSYSAFALSFFISVCYLAKDAAGGDKSRLALARRLPSLESLDVLNYKIIALGFPLLTLGIALGAVWASTAWGRPWGFDPKETWSAVTWLLYAVYLHARHLAGWKGRRAAILSLVGFGGVLFTYLGVNYLLPGLHSYV